MFLLLFLLALFIAVNGAFSLSVGYAEGASQNGVHHFLDDAGRTLESGYS